MKNTLTFLGTGTSTGIPMVGCDCAVCRSKDPRDTRLRTSLLLNTKNLKTILIDTGPDVRHQLLSVDCMHIDGAIITHAHADHLNGIDDLRPYCFGPPKRQIPVYTSDITAENMRARFAYIFKAKELFNESHPVLGGGIPLLNLETVNANDQEVLTTEILGETFHFFLLPHGYTQTLGFVHDDLCYIPDCNEVPSGVLEGIKALKPKLLVITCLQKRNHNTHLTIDQSFHYTREINADRTRYVHMNHETSDQYLRSEIEKHLPNFDALPAYDLETLEY